MIINQDKLLKIIEEIVKSTEVTTVDEMRKKIQGREINIIFEAEKLDLFSASLLSAFFIKYIDIDFPAKYISDTGKSFDKDLIVSIHRVNNVTYELTDVDNHKIRVPKNEITCTVAKAPLDTLLNLLN